MFYELRKYRLRTTPETQAKRLGAFLEKELGPALARTGAQLAGAFTNYIGVGSPTIYTLASFSSLRQYEESLSRLQSDSAYQQALASLDQGGYPFERIDSSLLKAFSGMPKPLLSSAPSGGPRLFELRCYQSQTEATLIRKVKMFNGGEIGIFERLGMRPVFFGETIIGQDAPNLYYMLSYESLAAREELWKKFGSDPEWKKLSAPEPLHDDQIVSNISNTILKPLPFSPIQ